MASCSVSSLILSDILLTSSYLLNKYSYKYSLFGYSLYFLFCLYKFKKKKKTIASLNTNEKEMMINVLKWSETNTDYNGKVAKQHHLQTLIVTVIFSYEKTPLS